MHGVSSDDGPDAGTGTHARANMPPTKRLGHGSGSRPAPSLQQYAAPASALVLGVALSLCWLAGDNAATLDRHSERVSALVNGAVPFSAHAETTVEHGQRIAQALNMRSHMQHIVESYPGASFISHDPPIIRFAEFLSDEECDAVQRAAEPDLQPSTLTGALLDNGTFQRDRLQTRTSCVQHLARDATSFN